MATLSQPQVTSLLDSRASFFGLSAKKEFPETKPINQYKDVSSVNEMRAIVIALEKESLKKNKEARQTLKELRDLKSNVRSNNKIQDGVLKTLKSEKSAALVEAKKVKDKSEVLSESTDDLEANLSQAQMRCETNESEMEDLEDELNTWKENSQSAVQASQADTDAMIGSSANEKRAAIKNAEKLKKLLKDAKAKVVNMKNSIKNTEEATEKTRSEIQETREYITTKTQEFERALIIYKQEADLTFKSCKNDAGTAQKHLFSVQEESDAAIAKVTSLKHKVAALNVALASLEDEQIEHDKEYQQNLSRCNTMKNELMKSKEEFENAIKACEIDISAAYSKIRICVAEKESALADADEAKTNLRQVNKALRVLKAEMEEETLKYNLPWWKKIFRCI